MRADARRNRQRLLDAASEIFAEQGLSVPIDEVAKRAGVGAGTLYRHFPTKVALYEAILIRHIEVVADEARSLADAPDPGVAFYGFLTDVVEHAISKTDIADALSGAGIDFKSSVAAGVAGLNAAVETLLIRAQEQGAVRSDVTVDDVFSLVGSACMAAGRPGCVAPQRMLGIICDGLRSPSLINHLCDDQRVSDVVALASDPAHAV